MQRYFPSHHHVIASRTIIMLLYIKTFEYIDLFMKNASYLFYLLFFFVASCSGDDEGEPQPGGNDLGLRKFENCRVMSEARENFKTTYYEYDDQQRLKLQTNNESYRAEYDYNGSQITLKTYSYDELATTLTITVDGEGRPLQWVKVHANGVLKTETKIYEYDDKGQLVKTTVTYEGSTTEKHQVYQWLDGNMIAESEPDGSKMTKYTYSSKENQPVDWFGEIGVDYGLRAIRNKNRVATITDRDGDVFEHSYSEDSNGMVTSRTIKTPDITYTNEFTLECK